MCVYLYNMYKLNVEVVSTAPDKSGQYFIW